MSGPSTPGAKPEKTMSSRLLAMKFMQRAAAAQAAAAANAQSSAAQPDDNLPAAKRPRLSTDGPRAPSHASDLEAISAAVAAEEQKRAEAVARQAAEAGETEWVLDFPGAEEMGAGYAPQPYIVPAGSLDAEDEGMGYGGRRSYGNFKRKKKTTAEDTTSEDSDSDDDLDENDLDDPSQIDAMIRRAKAKAKKKEKEKEKKIKPVKLSQLTSISGAGGLMRHHGGGKAQKRKKR
ncbi:hypothetical protein M432DRAFT_318767 [Thermoascus aurantiacus ATCC 26904]